MRTRQQQEILAKGRMIFEMCLQKESIDCVLGFVDDQIKSGNLDLMKDFFDQFPFPETGTSPLEREALSEIEKRILRAI